MNREVQWRIEFGQELSRRLAAFQKPGGIRASAIGGSVARGFSDIYSDLELILIWENPPDLQIRQEITATLQAEYRFPPTDPGQASAFLVKGFPVDFWHLTIASEEAFLHQVLEEYSLDLVANNRLDTFRYCLPLSGESLLSNWKTRIEKYPDELAVQFLKAYLPHFHLRQLNLVAHRNNPTAYYHTLTDIQCSLFMVLLALNREYFPTFKWMYPLLKTFKIQPGETAARLRRMFEVTPVEAAAQLKMVLGETLALIEELYPGLDTNSFHSYLEQPARSYNPPSEF